MNTVNKLIKSTILSSIILISSINSVYAQEENYISLPDEVVANYKGLGLTAGFLSGLGFSYRQYFADRLGFKATGIAFFDQNQTFGNIGLQGMYVLSENDWLRFYGLVGVSNFTSRRANYSYNNPSSPDSDYVYIPARGASNFEAYNSVGAGIGIELGRLSQGLSFAVELPVVATFKGTSFSSLYPIPSISVIYNF